MQPHHLRLAEILEGARPLPAQDRQRYLLEACGDDEALRHEIERLLEPDEGLSSALLPSDTAATRPRDLSEGASSSGSGPKRASTDDLGAESAGDIIDGYRLLQEIGEGGMGTVWMAEQSEPVRRKVALKIIKLGMDTKEVVARFEAERQALALMEHSHIAKVFDAGATRNGRPYFVMELVNGLHITDHCDEFKLGLRDRLELFQKVCAAIQHAHHKGIIHRDIKPSNVLVTVDGGIAIPKVIDFGVAKATCFELTEKTLFTRHGQVVGTLEYMAPEQAVTSGVDVDTRADVYALGALLYEILSGSKPFDFPTLMKAGFDELLRTIREVDPATPSTKISTLGMAAHQIALNRHADVPSLKRRLRGDLDWIVMRALEKDRRRRYETPFALAADVSRYLNNEAVEAHPPSALYRIRKLVRRRKKTVVAAMSFLFLLVGGSTGTGFGWWKASQANRALDIALDEKSKALRNEEKQRQLAERNEQRARLAEEDATRAATRAQNAESAALERAEELERVATFQAEQLRGVDPLLMGVRLRQALLAAVPEGQRESLEQSLIGINFTDIALGTLRENLFARTIQAIDSRFAEQPLVRAQLLQTIADTLFALGLLEEARGPQERALSIRRSALGGEHLLTLESISNTGLVLHKLGRLSEAEPYHREALEVARRTLGDEHPRTLASMSNIGLLFQDQGKLGEAEQYERETLEARRRTLGDEHPETLVSISNLGVLLLDQGRLVEAEPLYREALETRRRILGDEHPDTLGSIQGMGILLRNQGKPSKAEPYYREALETSRRILGAEHPLSLRSMNNLGILLQNQGKLTEAEPYCRDALEGRRRVLGDDHPNTLVSINNMGLLLYKQGKLTEAEPYYREAIQTSRRTLGDQHRYTRGFNSNLAALLHARLERARESGEPLTIVESLADYAAHLTSQGESDQAEPYATEALELLGGIDEPSRRLACLRSQLGLILASFGRFEEAESLILKSAQWILTGEGARPSEESDGTDAGLEVLSSVIELFEQLHRLHPEGGHDKEAESWRRKRTAWVESRNAEENE